MGSAKIRFIKINDTNRSYYLAKAMSLSLYNATASVWGHCALVTEIFTAFCHELIPSHFVWLSSG